MIMAKVFLKKDYISKGGNFYGAGYYEQESLPEVIRDNSDYVKITEVVVPKEPLVENGIRTITSDDGPRTREIKPIIGEPVKSDIVKEEPFININKASEIELSSLKGIGRSTAKKVIELREVSPFVSFSDLEERVGLWGGRTWDSYNIKFES